MPEERASLLKLPPDIRKRLEQMDADLAEAKKAIEVLKKIGIDTRQMEERLTWSEDVRKILLTEFS